MTNASSAPIGDLLNLTFSEPLLKLVRLLAREAARADIATRCNARDGAAVFVSVKRNT